MQDTLGGGAPPPNFTSQQRNMPYIPNGHSSSPSHPTNDVHAQSIAALQSQLNETQTSLAGHVGKIRDLEGLLAEHDVIKREVGSLRKQMEEAKRDMERMMRGRGQEEGDILPTAMSRGVGGSDGRESPVAKLLEAEEDDDDDDARSVSSVDTISPLDSTSTSTSQGSKINGVVSALTGAAAGPTSSKLASSDDQEADLARERQLQEQNAKLSARLETLSAELDEATKLGQSLRSQHAEASSTIRALEERVQGLEKAVEGRVAEVEGKVLKEVEGRWNGWREKFEASWQKERAGWEEERGKLMAVVREWEERRRDGGGSSSEEDDSDSSSEDEEADESRSRDITSASLGPLSSTSTSSTPKSKRNRSRRRRRTTAIAPTSATLAQRSSAGSSGVTSDSDSTIGSGGLNVGGWSSPAGSKRGSTVGGHDGTSRRSDGVASVSFSCLSRSFAHLPSLHSHKPPPTLQLESLSPSVSWQRTPYRSSSRSRLVSRRGRSILAIRNDSYMCCSYCSCVKRGYRTHSSCAFASWRAGSSSQRAPSHEAEAVGG